LAGVLPRTYVPVSLKEVAMRAGKAAWLPLVLVVLSCASQGAPKVPEAPDETVRFLASGLADARPQVVWQGLPPSWQAELTVCLQESAEKSDPEIYTAGWSVAGKIVRVLEEKQAFILDHPMLAAQVKDRAKTETLLRGVAGMMRTLMESELADREALRKIDVEKFLAGTGATLFRQVMELAIAAEGRTPGVPFRPDQLRLEDVAVVSQVGDAARLRVVMAGGKSSEQDWVRVEGRWVPKAMVDGWPKAMAGLRQQIETAAPTTPERKQAVLVQLRMVESALDSVLATATPAEYQAAAGTALGTLMGAAMAQAQALGPFGGAPSPAPTPAPITEPEREADGSSVAEAAPADQFLRRHPIAVRDAGRHLGASVHIVAVDGAEFDGTLRAADGRTLTVERESEAGTMTHAMAVRDVKALHVWR
jgi:hypothetical protein